MELAQLIEAAVKFKASDIHLTVGHPPRLRVDDELRPLNQPAVTSEQMLEYVNHLVPEKKRPILEQRRGVDVGHNHQNLVRLRVNAFYQRESLALVLRLIPMRPPNPRELELPTVVDSFTHFRRGMVLVTGPAGSGKSTTLAVMIDILNTHGNISIATIEDPIEYVFENKKAMITQREVGEDVNDFSSGLIQTLRQDPDVIMVGELRDLETMRVAIQGAETGHLILGTLHTRSAIKTIDRIISIFPQAEHAVLFEQLSTNLRAVMTQELVKRAEGHGRIAALEILVVTQHVAKLIREKKLHDILEVMRAREEKMQTLDQGLADLVHQKKITEEEAGRYAEDLFALRRYVKGVKASGDAGGLAA